MSNLQVPLKSEIGPPESRGTIIGKADLSAKISPLAKSRPRLSVKSVQTKKKGNTIKKLFLLIYF
jgi:hypothetical protein